MEFKGTKGEWNVIECFRKPVIINESNIILFEHNINCYDKSNKLNTYYSHKKMMSNAKLIAAAPDLLKALIKTVEWYGKREYSDFEDVLCDAKKQTDIIQFSLKAINKALK